MHSLMALLQLLQSDLKGVLGIYGLAKGTITSAREIGEFIRRNALLRHAPLWVRARIIQRAIVQIERPHPGVFIDSHGIEEEVSWLVEHGYGWREPHFGDYVPKEWSPLPPGGPEMSPIAAIFS